MPIRPNLSRAEFDALPEAIPKGEVYRVEGAGNRADVTGEGGFELTNTQNLLATVSATRGERDDFERQLRETRTEFEGVDLTALRGDQTRLRELLANGDPTETATAQLAERERVLSEQFAQRSASADEVHATAISERDARIDVLDQQLDDEYFENEATRAIRAVDPDATIRFILPELRGMSRVMRGDDGKRRLEVLDVNGTVRYESVEGNAQPMGLGGLVTELQAHPELGRAFSGGNASGSGASPQIGSVGGVDGVNVFDSTSEHFNLTKQAELVQTNPQEAARLKALAPVAKRRPMIDDRQPSGGLGNALTPGR